MEKYCVKYSKVTNGLYNDCMSYIVTYKILDSNLNIIADSRECIIVKDKKCFDTILKDVLEDKHYIEQSKLILIEV